MACFVVSAASAAVVTAVEKHMEHVERVERVEKNADETVTRARIPVSAKLRWLSRLLWGGAILLAFEHLWHGEVTPWFPFLTAMSSPEDAAAMFHEMATTGVCMTLLVIAVWVVMCAAADRIVKRQDNINANININMKGAVS